MEQELLSKNYTTISIGPEMAKYNNEITIQIKDTMHNRSSLVGEAFIDITALSYSLEICGWYNLYASSMKERTGQILLRITPQHSVVKTVSPLEEGVSEILLKNQ